MTRTQTLVALAGSLLALSVAPVLAAPPVLDMVPADAALTITLPSLDKMDADVRALATAAELPAEMFGVQQMLMMAGLDEGMATDRPIAIFMRMPAQMPAEGEEPPMVGLMPVTNFQAIADGLGAEEVNGLMKATMDTEEVYFKSVGGANGYAVFSSHEALVRDFTGAKGNMAAHVNAMGPAGDALTDRCMVSFIVNVPAFRPMIEEGLKQAAANMADGAGGFGVDANPIDSPAAKWLIEAMMRDTEVVVGGVSMTARGAGFESTMRFTADSPMAKAFSRPGNASGTMARLPKQDYLLAWSFDVSNPHARAMLKQATEVGKDGGNGVPNMFMAQLDKVEANAMMIGASPGAMFGAGLFSNTVAFIKSADPQGYIAGMRGMLSEMNGTAAQGMAIQTTYSPGAATVKGTSADAWEVKMQPDGSNMMAGQALMMMFGPTGGPAGYVAATRDGVVQTYAKNSILLGASLDAAQGGDSFTSDQATSQVSGSLPSGRLVESYIGLKPIMEMVGPLLAMATGQQLPVPESLPPVGLGLGVDRGQAHFGLFIPAPVVKMAGSIGMEAMMGGGGMNFEDDGDDAGQPRF